MGSKYCLCGEERRDRRFASHFAVLGIHVHSGTLVIGVFGLLSSLLLLILGTAGVGVAWVRQKVAQVCNRSVAL